MENKKQTQKQTQKQTVVTSFADLLKEIKWLKKDSSNSLNLLAGINRAILPAQVTKLANSILSMGIIRPVVVANISFIDGISKKYIVDGQHLFFALIRNNMDIPYVTIDIKDKQDLIEKIALLNTSSKSWCTLDYVTAWASIKEDYKILATLYRTYDIELGQLAQIAHKNSVGALNGHAGGSFYRIIKNGDFKIEDLKKTEETLGRVTDVLKVIPRMDRFSNNVFIAAYTRFIMEIGPRYKHPEMLVYLKKNKQQFATVTQDPEEMDKLLKKAVK